MDFPSNSHKSKEEKPEKPKKDIQKVVTGEVVQKAPSVGRKFKAIFFGGEFKSAARFIMGEVLLPAFKNMVVDATSKGVERMVYGDTSPRRRNAPYDMGRPLVSYNRMSDRGRRATLPDQPPLGGLSRRHTSGDIILVSRDEAELVLERLHDVLDQYEVAAVADLHELVGLPSSYVDNKWGWTRLTGADVRQVREGYLLVLPPVEPI